MRWVAVRKYAPINVAGVTFNNVNGSSRQQIIRGLEKGMKVKLLREPGNLQDPNAIAVLVTGQQIGYIPSESAEKMAAILDDDHHDIQGEIAEVKHFQPDDQPGPIWIASISLVQYELREVQSGFAALARIAGRLIGTVVPRLLLRAKRTSLTTAAIIDRQLNQLARNDVTFLWILRGIALAAAIVLVLLVVSLLF